MIFYVISSLRPRTMLQLLFAHRDTTLLRSGGWLGSRLTSIGLHVEPTETQSRHISKLKLTISHKNKGHTHTLTLKKFDRACKRQGISETESFFWSLKPLRFRLSLAETNLALSKGNQLTTAISATERRMASDG